MNLTNEQKIILDNSNKNIYISAAPGSGKSTMLSHIAARLLENPSNFVLLVTFTNKAAKSIISKCGAVDQKRILGGTFHGLANLFSKQNGIFWNICDEGKKRLIIRKLFDCKKDKNKLIELIDEISLAKSEWPLRVTANVSSYNSELAKYNLIDFDDMIYNIIASLPSMKLPPITHLLVDELQDTSGPQLAMLKALQARLNCKVIGVSDDDQTIYQWRGARPENVQEFIDTFKCNILNMGINFRSCTSIVQCSRRLIQNNKRRIQKEIKEWKTDEGYVSHYKSKTPLAEISYVVSKCRQNSGQEIAILYRNRSFKNHLEFELKKAGIKYCVNDSLEISDRSAIKVMISCMKLAAQIGDIYDLEIASKGLRGVGKTTITNIKKEIGETNLSLFLRDKFLDPKNHKKFDSLISIISYFNGNKNHNLQHLAILIEKYFIKSFDYQEDMKNFIHDITKEYKINATDIRDISNDLGLDGKEENQDKDAKVELSTIHGYKGIEKEIVIMPWCNMFDPQAGKDYDTEDERRLFYVGITRAKTKLYLSYSGEEPKFIGELEI